MNSELGVQATLERGAQNVRIKRLRATICSKILLTVLSKGLSTTEGL